MSTPRALYVSAPLLNGQILFGDNLGHSDTDEVPLQVFDPKSESWSDFVNKPKRLADGSYQRGILSLLPKVDRQVLQASHLWEELPMSEGLTDAYYGGPMLAVGNDAAEVSEPILLANGDQFFFRHNYYRVDAKTQRIKPAADRAKGALLNMVVLPDKRIFFCRYEASLGSSSFDEVIFDPVADSWTPVIDSEPCVGRTMTLLPDGKILAIGGAWVQQPNAFIGSLKETWFDFVAWIHPPKFLPFPAPTYYRVTSTCRLYDPVSNKWMLTDALHVPRAFQTTNLLPGGRILVSGGYTEPKDDAMTATCEVINVKDIDP